MGFTYEDLWFITRGQLCDYIVAYNYKKYIERRDKLTYAIDVITLKHGKCGSVEEICGRWLDNRVMTWSEANKWVIENASKKKVRHSNSGRDR